MYMFIFSSINVSVCWFVCVCLSVHNMCICLGLFAIIWPRPHNIYNLLVLTIYSLCPLFRIQDDNDLSGIPTLLQGPLPSLHQGSDYHFPVELLTPTDPSPQRNL